MQGIRLRPVGAVLLLLLIVLALATARPGDPRLYPPRPADAQVIYLVDNGFHSDLVLPRAAIMAHGGPLAEAAAASADDWIMVGWGDARFYAAATPWQGRLADAVSAALGGRPTTVHLEGVPRRPDLAWTEGVRRIALSSAGLAALMARVDRSFALTKAGAPVPLPVTRDPDEAFFASVEPFSAIHVCNDWTAELLSAAGLPTTPVLDTLPAGLWLDLKLRSGL
jgi:uncharacterized protein (TIGR02117 family)